MVGEQLDQQRMVDPAIDDVGEADPLLDRSRTRAGRPDAEALTATIERAKRAEALGYVIVPPPT